MTHHCREFKRILLSWPLIYNAYAFSFDRLLNVNESVLSITPTMIKIRQLFDNYEIDTSVNEYVSPMERQEEAEFLDAVLATPIMKAAMRFLQSKGIFSSRESANLDDSTIPNDSIPFYPFM